MALTRAKASQVTVKSDATGGVVRSLHDKLNETVSVKDFGAVGDGVTDDYASILSAAQACSLSGQTLYFPVGDYVMKGGITGTTQSVSYLDILMEHNTVILPDDSAGGFDLFKDIDTLIIRNGSIGNSSYFIDGDYGTIRYTQNATELFIENVDFNGNSAQQHCIYSDVDTGPNKFTAIKCDFRNFLHEAMEIYAETEGNTESKYLVDNCYFKNMGSSSISANTRAILIGNNTSRLDNIVVRNCRVWQVRAGNGGCNGILLYGNSVVVDGNHVEDVYNTLGDDAEGIYVKATNARIVNNYVLNGGNSHDGCINIKGVSWDNDDQEAGYSIIANNSIELTNESIDVPAITVNKSNVICTNNMLKDLRSNRASMTIGNAIGLGTSAPVANVIIADNVITGFKNIFGEDSTYRALPTHNVLINGNVCTQIAGGNIMSWRSDAKIDSTFVFTAATSSIAYSNTSEVGFDPYVYRVGDTIQVVNSAANDGVYTIASVSKHELTVNESITDSTSTAQTYLESPDGFVLRDNIFSYETQGVYGFRKRGGAETDIIKINDNVIQNCLRGFRIDAGTPALVDLRNNTYKDVSDIIYGSVNATEVKYYSPDSSNTTGGSGSAGAGNQYLELSVNGTTYKVLHDGTI